MASILVPGTYMLPVIGEIVITASLTILVGKAVIDAGTEININKLKKDCKFTLLKKQRKLKSI